jgi:hypothetical protein
MHQISRLAVILSHRADVALTTVLHLTTEKSSVTSDPLSPLMPYSETSPPTKESHHLLYAQPTIYLIAKQEDLYQLTDMSTNQCPEWAQGASGPMEV